MPSCTEHPTETDEPEHQERDHAVACRRCKRRMTWNLNAICNRCEAKS